MNTTLILAFAAFWVVFDFASVLFVRKSPPWYFFRAASIAALFGIVLTVGYT